MLAHAENPISHDLGHAEAAMSVARHIIIIIIIRRVYQDWHTHGSADEYANLGWQLCRQEQDAMAACNDSMQWQLGMTAWNDRTRSSM